MLGIYGAFGLDGLAHYTLALCSEHTLLANITIWSEATSGLLLLLFSSLTLGRRLSPPFVDAWRTANHESTRSRCRGILGLLLSLGSAAAQQAAKVHRIGYLQIAPRATQVHLIEAFERGLTERGYVVGRDILIEYRFADGKPERLDRLA